MSDFLYNYEIQPFEQRALVRQQLEDNKRAQVLGLEGRKAQDRASEILKGGFDDLVESTRDSVRALEASQAQIEYFSDDLSGALDNVSAELEGVNRNVDEGLTRVDKTLVGGFVATNIVLGAGFTALHEKLEECTEEIVGALEGGFSEVVQSIDEGFHDVRETLDEGFGEVVQSIDKGSQNISKTLDKGFTEVVQSIDKGSQNICETMDEGFGEISSLLDDVAIEISDTRASIDSGFEELGALFDWGFSGLIAQAELQNEKLKQIITILEKPVTIEARNLLSHAVTNYQRRFTAEALESFSFLLEEKKYRVVFSTYFPIYRFIADIYFFDRRDYDRAREYYELTLKYTLEDENTRRLRSLLHLCIGHCHYFKKEFVQAIECAEKSLKTKYSTEAEYQLAQYYALNGEKDKALSHLKSVLNSDRKYVFRVLQELDLVSIKKEIQQLLIWLKRMRDLGNLKLKIVEIEKGIRQEIEKNRQLNLDSGVLERWPPILERALKTVDKIDGEFKADSPYSLSWAKKSQFCRGSIYRLRSIIRASHSLLKSNELQRLEKEKQEAERKKAEELKEIERKRQAQEEQKRRELEAQQKAQQEAEKKKKAEELKEIEKRRQAQEEKKKKELEAQQKAQQEAQRQADIIRIKTEVENYQKELSEAEVDNSWVFGLTLFSLILSIISLAIGFYHLVELISFDPEKNKIEIAQKEAEKEAEIAQKEAEWRQVKQNQGWWESIFGNSKADKIAREYWGLRNRKISDLRDRENSIANWTWMPMLIGFPCLAAFIFLTVLSVKENKKLQLLRDKKNYIDRCEEWLKKQT